MNVTSFDLSDWDKDGTIVKVTTVRFDDGTEVRGYDLPDGIENGKPLPGGWTVAESKNGKPYIKVPKKGGGGYGGGAPAFRNTKEGMLADQAHWDRKQAIEQERMDRRTALMQAVAVVASGYGENALNIAGKYYEWLRQTSGPGMLGKGVSGSGNTSAGPSAEGTGQVSTPTVPADHGGGVGSPNGEEASSPPPAKKAPPAFSCGHPDNSPLKPDGSALPSGFVRCLSCGTVHKEA